MKQTRTTKEDLEQVRHIEGFPIGEDDSIINLSIPPHYTTFPNPYIGEFIEFFGNQYNELDDYYSREPFVSDVSQGKSDSFYRAHTYHTKVPYKAIQPFIYHYTNPDDIVFDGFCGSGMTGVAAKLSGRNAILSDLSPIASFIAKSNTSFDEIDLNVLAKKAEDIEKQVFKEVQWMFKTEEEGKEQLVNHVIWSDIFICPYCNEEFNYSDSAADFESKEFKKENRCPNCSANLDQKKLERVWENNIPKRIPVLLSVQEGSKTFYRETNDYDIKILDKINSYISPYFYPTSKFLRKGENFGDMYVKSHHKGLDTVDKFYLKRSLSVLANIFDKVKKEENPYQHALLFIFTSIVQRSSLLNRLRPSLSGDPMTGTLYIASLVREENPLRLFNSKTKAIIKAYKDGKKSSNKKNKVLVQTNSATDLQTIPESSIDYVFTDPPFGRNLMYSELNFLWESWLSCFTNNTSEAIKNNSQKKGVPEYSNLMFSSFKEFYRILKPNRWITVVFHNSEAVIWNAIQESMVKAGFIIAQVATLDKKQGSYKQVTEAGSVKHDLIINAYKPLKEFKEKFLKFAGVDSEYIFVKQHLEHLPKDRNIERTEHMLYSKMLATYIQHGFEINMNAKEFYLMLAENFEERDGYWFTQDEVKEYEDKKKNNKLKDKDLAGGALFVLDEKSAIAWLNHFLEEPKDYNSVYTEFLKALSVSEDQIPELRVLLNENFVTEGGLYRRPRGTEREEIEEIREKRLNREFENILNTVNSSKKSLVQVRKEAVISGFLKCYNEKRFEDILNVSKKLPKRLIENSTEIYDFIDIARSKVDDF